MTQIPDELSHLRKRIDRVDMEILRRIAKRQHLVKEVAAVKKKHDLAIKDNVRERQMMITRQNLGKSLGVSATCIKKLFRIIITEAKTIQKETT